MKYSPESFFDINALVDRDALASLALDALAATFKLQALFVVRYNIENQTLFVQWAQNVPIAPFRGSDSHFITEVIDDCFKAYPKPHVHAIGKAGLVAQMCRLNRSLQDQKRMWFCPLRCDEDYFVLLGLPLPESGDSLPKDFKDRVAQCLQTLSTCARTNELTSRLDVTERFVKEIGHDLASAVQATVAKLSAIVEGRIEGEGVRLKAKEIEDEIWGAYRVAECLGIAVDTHYELRQPDDFDLLTSINKVLTHYASEAAERHILFAPNVPDAPVIVWGEKLAIEQAIGQLMSNAVKYGYGGSVVNVSVSVRRDDIVIRVSDRGIPLPAGEDLKLIWDFGFRGAEAKERHVNGSGIGLYTVKKIITAHQGWVDVRYTAGHTDFFIHLPTRATLKKALGILL